MKGKSVLEDMLTPLLQAAMALHIFGQMIKKAYDLWVLLFKDMIMIQWVAFWTMHDNVMCILLYIIYILYIQYKFYDVILYYIVSYYTMVYYITSYCITLHSIILYYIILTYIYIYIVFHYYIQ